MILVHGSGGSGPRWDDSSLGPLASVTHHGGSVYQRERSHLQSGSRDRKRGREWERFHNPFKVMLPIT
jgi:hypothetical protein